MLHYRKSKLNISLVNKQKENSGGVWDQVNGRLYRCIHFNIYRCSIVFAICIYVICDTYIDTIISTHPSIKYIVIISQYLPKFHWTILLYWYAEQNQ